MVNIEIPDDLYEEFVKEKDKLDSTLSTIEILKDKDFFDEINVGLMQLNEGESKTYSMDDIDKL